MSNTLQLVPSGGGAWTDAVITPAVEAWAAIRAALFSAWERGYEFPSGPMESDDPEVVESVCGCAVLGGTCFWCEDAEIGQRSRGNGNGPGQEDPAT
jgi:hypothetical protein